MSGHGVPQSVRSEVRGTVNDLQTAMNDPPDHPRIDSSAAVPDEHCGAGLRRDEARPGWPEPFVQGPKRRTADRHAPFLPALAEYPHNPPVAVEIVDVESDQLRDPDPGRVQQFQDRRIA